MDLKFFLSRKMAKYNLQPLRERIITKISSFICNVNFLKTVNIHKVEHIVEISIFRHN